MRLARVLVTLLAAFPCFASDVPRAAAQERGDFGTLSIQARPTDAEVLIDGERWPITEHTGLLQLQLPPGRHRVEVRAPGLQPFDREVAVRAGETTTVNVALTRGEPAALPPPEQRPPGRPASVQSSGGIVRSMEDGPVIAPDFRVTEINHHTAQLMGAYGGYVFGGQFLAGAGGYWQMDSTHGTHLTYFGPVFEWRMFHQRTVGLNLHGLVGGGWRFADFYPVYPAPVGYPVPYGWYNQGFFLAEPEAQVVVRFASSLRLQGGVGYRVTSADGLNGVSGSISVQFGR
jgi:hypothetical protein